MKVRHKKSGMELECRRFDVGPILKSSDGWWTAGGSWIGEQDPDWEPVPTYRDVTADCHVAMDGNINTPNGNLASLQRAGKAEDYRLRKVSISQYRKDIGDKDEYHIGTLWAFIVEKRNG